MHIWQKRVTADWLGKHSDQFATEFGDALAIIERPGKAPIVQITVPRQKAAVQLTHNFGGTVEKLRTDWLRQFTGSSRSKPLRIGSRLIVASAPSNQSNARTIVIPAEAAFGTGEHATTSMCLRMLERLTRSFVPGWSMLDAGTGSGILAIAGSRFGASRIIAIDNDPLACATAQRNARANRIRNIEFRTGDALNQKFRGEFDVVTANLFSDLLIAALPRWRPNLAENGRLILSGVLRSQESALVTALRRNGCGTEQITRRGKWIAVLARPVRKRS